ncbi:TonB-dependent receptor [Novosphingobium nitrogenifigens DSM 19370]|uniref:TonB-dependent receptor n=1 Tax=Novosphingobium nitrogenifigens DSM 19370 TaxID=983920 RepID=F1Z4R7_9SPHN|nr:TonB-dependent receptor [Novosphingobium nitrogenifigens]EGD60396.1 TonB-dependent receptor [Novosphingobium nitrogenifigens DSM 19370]
MTVFRASNSILVLACLAGGGMAFAAEPAPTPAPEPGEGAAAQAPIYVTARRRVEDEHQVPAALNALGADLLTRTYTVNVNQLMQLVPSLNYSSPNPRNTAFTIRGLGSSVVAISQANDGLEPGVGFYVDQVYHARPATAAFDFTDLEQVEVLRGPQGTLFGKNTTAGAINITTKAPEFKYGADGEFSVGNQNYWQAKAAITGPLVSDVLAFRLSGLATRRDGVIYNVKTQQWVNNVHSDAVRGQLLYQPTKTFSLRIIGDWSDFNNNCCTQVYVGVAPTLKSAAQQYAALAAGVGYSPPSTNPYDRLTDIDAALGVNTNEGGVSAIAEWKLAAVTLTSVSAWRFWNWDAANDRDYTGLAIQEVQHIPSRQDQFSQELRAAGSVGHIVDYVGGFYYFRQKIVGHPISIYGPLATYWLLPAGRPSNLLDGYQSSGTTDFTTDSLGVFGEVTGHLTSRLALTGGIRYTYEVKDGSYDVQTSGGLTTGLTTSQISDKASILRAQSYTGRVSDGSASGRVNLAWTPVDPVMIYASYARSQKSGGINMSGLPVYPSGVSGHASGDPILSTVTVRPEHNTTIEAGIKTRWLNGAVVANLTGYITRVRDFQANVVDNAAVVALRSYLANIPRVRVRGIEFDGTAQIGRYISLRASGAYADGRYISYANGPCPIELTGSSTAQCDLSGKGLPGLPHWTGTIGGEGWQPLGKGEVFLRADVSARTSIYGDATDSAYTKINGYTLVNATIGFRGSQGWEAALFVRNVFNVNYLQNVTVQAGNSGLIVGTPSDPRMFGFTLRFHV